MSFENMFNAASTHSITEDEKQAWANFALVGSKPNVFKNSKTCIVKTQ